MKPLSRKDLRQHAAELVIALCLCGGGYFFFVKPAETELAKTNAAIAQAQSLVTQANTTRLNWSANRAALDRAERLAEEIDLRSMSARDETAMFTTLSQTAADYGVLVDAIQPARQAAKPHAAPPAGGAAPAREPSDVVTSYTIELRGGYANVVRMLAALEEENAYTVIERVQLQTIADPERPLVRAVIKLDRLAFDTALLHEAIAGTEDPAHAEGTP